MLKKIVLLLFGLSLLLFIPSITYAQSEEKIKNFNVDLTVNNDATVTVKEKIDYFLPESKHGIFRVIPNRYLDKTQNKYFKTPISSISIKDRNGTPIPFSQSQAGGGLELKIGDADKTVSGDFEYDISYTVSGIINNFTDHDELYYNATGNDWEVPIGAVSAKVLLPGQVSENDLQKSCFTGITGGDEQNCSATVSGNTITYQSTTGPLTIVAGWNKGLITATTRQYEKSYRHESVWFWLIPLFVLILMLILYFRKGKDPFGRGTIVPEFESPDDLKAAELGSLLNEQVDNNDISATLIDLAIRGYIKIKKTDKKYAIVKIKEADGKTLDYEKKLLEAILEGKIEASLDDIDIGSEISEIKDTIYQEMADKKYFVQNPNKIRKRYMSLGFIIMISFGIFFLISFHLAFAVCLAGIIIIIFSYAMPKKTREGVIVKEKALGLKEFLYRADRYKLKWQEKADIFEKFLPYAMVFGIAGRWAGNFKNIYDTPPSWYDGNFNTFSAVVFANEMSRFSSAAASSYSPPASSGGSGFSGGSSGGGFGGGGGGSW